MTNQEPSSPSLFLAIYPNENGEIMVGGQGHEHIDPETLVHWLKIATAKMELFVHKQVLAAIAAQNSNGLLLPPR